jgi:hypothetical protein
VYDVADIGYQVVQVIRLCLYDVAVQNLGSSKTVSCMPISCMSVHSNLYKTEKLLCLCMPVHSNLCYDNTGFGRKSVGKKLL